MHQPEAACPQLRMSLGLESQLHALQRDPWKAVRLISMHCKTGNDLKTQQQGTGQIINLPKKQRGKSPYKDATFRNDQIAISQGEWLVLPTVEPLAASLPLAWKPYSCRKEWRYPQSDGTSAPQETLISDRLDFEVTWGVWG